jgi:hypothetical protein
MQTSRLSLVRGSYVLNIPILYFLKQLLISNTFTIPPRNVEGKNVEDKMSK